MKSNIKRLILASTALCFGLAFAACSSNDEDVTALPVVEMPQSDAGVFAVDYHDVLDNGSYVYEYKVRLDKPAVSTLLCDISVDESLVDIYNAANNTSYKMMPSFVYQLQATDAIVKAGEQESNPLSISFASLYGLKEGEEYLLPIVATVDETCEGLFDTDSRSISYFRISIDGKLDYIAGLKMSTYSTDMYRTLTFADNEVMTIDENTHTFELLVYAYSWHSGTNYIGTWLGKDTGNNNEAFSGCELRVTGTSGASNIGNRQCDLTSTSQAKVIPANQWVRITVTCDGTQTGQNTEIAYRLYFNGEEIASAKPTKRWGASSSQRFKVGYTLNGFQFGYPSKSYYFDGLISEIRMWKRCLSPEEIKANLREITNPSADELYGYWRLDEGEGNTLKDCSGHGHDLVFPESCNVVWAAEYNDLPESN